MQYFDLCSKSSQAEQSSQDDFFEVEDLYVQTHGFDQNSQAEQSSQDDCYEIEDPTIQMPDGSQEELRYNNAQSSREPSCTEWIDLDEFKNEYVRSERERQDNLASEYPANHEEKLREIDSQFKQFMWMTLTRRFVVTEHFQIARWSLLKQC